MQRISRPFYRLAKFTPAAFCVAIFLGLAVLLALPGSAAASVCSSTVTVTSSNDSGAGTLREALVTVCTGGTINFAPSFSIGGPYTITLTTGQLSITRDMTITGPGADLLAVSGNNTSRVFSVSGGVNALIEDLAIRQGSAAAGNGGGILNNGVLTVTNSIVAGNSATYGGGIRSESAGNVLVVLNSTISDNSATNRGGGVSSYEGALTVDSSAFTANSAADRAGGVQVEGTGATATVVNSTFYSNTSVTMGGAIGASSVPVTVTNSTFSGNRASGGAVIRNAPGLVTLTNVLMEKSTGGHCSVQSQDFTDGGGNIADDASCALTAPTSRSNTNPLLTSPGDYGGGTQTMALLPGSPATDSGVAGSCPLTDGRGVYRPQGGACDSGAFESRGFALTLMSGSPQTTTVYSAFTHTLALTVSSGYAEPVGPGGVITFTPPSSGPGLTVGNPFTTTTGADGYASSGAITANAISGSYGVTATVGSGVVAPTICNGGGCGASELVFNLANEPITPTVALASAPNPSYFSQSVLLTADVTTDVPGAGAPTGVVTFTEGAQVLGASSLDANGQAILLVNDLTVGDHTLAAAYSGDGSFIAGSAQAITQTVDPAPTMTELQIKPNPASYGENVIFTVQVRIDVQSPGALSRLPSPSGRLTITDTTGVIDLTGWVIDGEAEVSGGVIPAGQYTVYATYQGDRAFAGSTSQPETLTVDKFATNTALGSNGSPVYVGYPLRFDVEVSEFQPNEARMFGFSVPTGAVVITDTSGAINLGSNLVNGLVMLNAPALAEGTYTVTAAYLGDERFAPSVSKVLVQVVERQATTTTLSIAPSQVNQGDEVVFTATLAEVDILGAGPQMSGHVVFTYGGVEFGRASVSGGVATLRSNLLPLGVHNIVAEYLGDRAFAGSTSQPETLRVDKFATNTALGSNGNPVYVGYPLRFNVEVSEFLPDAARMFGLSGPTGAVVITDASGAINLGGELVDGEVVLAAPQLTEGTYTVTAAYLGDARYAASTSTALVQVVARHATSTTLEVAPNPANGGEDVTFTATVSEQRSGVTAAGAGPRMSGHVVFTYGGVEFGRAAVSKGVAVLRSNLLPVGGHAIEAEYLGDNAFIGSISEPVTLTIDKFESVTRLGSSSNPAYVGEGLAFTVNVAELLPAAVQLFGLSGPTGAVVITDASGAINLGGELVDGEVVLAAPQLAEGTYTVTAAYLGDARYAASTSTVLVQMVARHATETALGVSPTTAKVGETVQFTAAVSSLDVTALRNSGPTGAVEFFADGVTLGSASVTEGQALLNVPASRAGVFTITAVYGGDSFYAANTSAPAALTVVKRSTLTTLTVVAPNPSRHGQAVLFTATVAEQVQAAAADLGPLPPSGQVIFRSDGSEIGRALLNSGAGSMTTGSLPVGSHAITVEYVGDSAFAPSNGGPATLVVQPMPLAVNDAAGAQGQPVTIDVTANDRDPAGGGLTIVSVTAPGHGSATITPGGPSVFYTPPPTFTGTDTFMYVMEDANGNRDDALVAVVVTHAPEGQGKPQVQAMNPGVNSSAAFTTPAAALGVQAPAGFFTGTLAEKDVLFISFTPVITPSQETNNPPANLKFGNLEFNLSLYLNDQQLEGQAFAVPLVLTISYDPSLIGALNAETLGLWYWNGAAWSTDGIVILSNDVTNHTITVSLSHFSRFAFFAAAPTSMDPGGEPQRAYSLYFPAMSK